MQTASSASSTWRARRSASEYTATVRMPSRRAVRMTRQAISPRLAMRIFWNIFASGAGGRSQRDVAVLAPRVVELLVAEHRQRPAQALAGLVGQDHVVDEAAVAGDERVGELLPVLLLAGGDPGRVGL